MSMYDKDHYKKKKKRLASSGGGTGLMSGQGTKIPHASLLNEKKKKRKKAFITDETLNNQEGRKT